jgi:hypothetical protein
MLLATLCRLSLSIPFLFRYVVFNMQCEIEARRTTTAEWQLNLLDIWDSLELDFQHLSFTLLAH